MARTRPITRFSIYWANLDPTVGHEIQKTRPVVVVSPDVLNNHLETVVVAPLTSTLRAYPFRPTVEVSGIVGQIALDQLRALDKVRLAKSMGQLDVCYHAEVLQLLQEFFME